MITESARLAIKYGYLKGVGKRYLSGAFVACQKEGISLEDYFAINIDESGKFSASDFEKAERYADHQISKALNYGHHVISMNDDAYPDSLRVIGDPPPILYCSGDIAVLKNDSVAVIGTREPTDHGRIIAERVTRWFVDNGWVITSGLAKGIDTIAHRTCVDSFGKTISVMAHGLEKVYPAANKELASQIVSGGGVLVSEYGYDSYVAKSNFVERDRIQSGLSKGVILVQSDVDGGSIHASRAVLKYGRYLVVLGQSIRDVDNKEPKISANILLGGADDFAKSQLLGIPMDGLKNLLYLRDKSGLFDISEILRTVSFSGPNDKTRDLFI
ncbi:DNA-processing protein DprA [Marinobacter nauticus]|uniref:DNA-processing protein DprA n=1 Tax=Marinobacter nauticus TaxID=2743 RepID=UPI0040444B77